MRYAGKEAILLLFLNALQVQCGTVLKTQNINKTDSLLLLKGYEWAACRCENGICVNEGGKSICKCNLGYGNFSETKCKACECGPDTNCMWESGWTGGKICFCKPGYAQKSGKCVGDPCSSNPCKNDGTCEAGRKQFKCKCKATWKGETCEENDPCSSNPCKNDGTCDSDGRGFKCKCNGHWKGDTCEENACTQNPCKNEGTCVVHGQGFKCHCIGKWKGETCEEDCNCGEYSKSCRYNWEDDQICDCFPGYAEKYGSCEECNCGPYGSCSFHYGQKTCNCRPSAFEKNGICIIMESTTLESTTALRTTMLPSTTQYCNCGEYSKSCRYNWRGDKICDCFPGYAEKYGSCEECNCGPYGSCSFQYGQKTCNCRPFAFEKNGICIIMESTTSVDTTAIRTTILPSTTKYCNCGEYSKSCRYNWRGDKICDCFPGYAEKYGSCDECNCGPYGSCSFQYGRKTCSCRSFQVEINGVCVEIGTISEGTTDSTILSSTVQECDCGPHGRCTLESGQKKCLCDPFTSEREGRCVDCYCGENSNSCHLNWKGDKICNCTSGYAQFYGFCYDCNCGVDAQSCFYRKNGTKVCNCDVGYTQTNGYCSAICSEEKCMHGKCEIMGNGFKCRCNEGFTGQRCEEKIQIKSNKLDIGTIMLLTVAFAIFILLSGMFCSLCRILNKISKK